MVVRARPWRFSVDDYHRMGETGILGEDDRVELIEGEVVAMPPIGSRHAGTVNRLNALFVRRLEGRAVVAPQHPVVLSQFSEPQPDLALLKPRDDFYTGRHPEPGDVLLLVEVSDTTLPFDRGVKAPLYARSGVLEYWILDVANRRLERFRSPGPSGYERHEVLEIDDRLAPEAFADVEVDLAELLGN